jgi:hypothetical protein
MSAIVAHLPEGAKFPAPRPDDRWKGATYATQTTRFEPPDGDVEDPGLASPVACGVAAQLILGPSDVFPEVLQFEANQHNEPLVAARRGSPRRGDPSGARHR